MGKLSEIATDIEAVAPQEPGRHPWANGYAAGKKAQQGEIDFLNRKIERLEAALDQVEEYLEGRVDVVDGSYGEPAPNTEMSLMTEIKIARGELP